jgi:hypothetical protein
MGAIRIGVNFRVKPGGYAELFESARAFKKVVERCGGDYLVGRVTTGADTGNIIVVHTYPSWTAFDKASSDPEMQRLLQAIYSNTNPPYESLTSNIIEEVPL